jgi:hypothetical protein
MKVNEIIVERKLKAGKVPKRYEKASTGLHTFSDGERSNTDYTHYRLGLALAMSDGKNSLDIDPKTFYGKKHTAHPYTQEEADMLEQGYKAVGANYKDLNKGDLSSTELDSTNKKSPTAPKKKNKYGV